MAHEHIRRKLVLMGNISYEVNYTVRVSANNAKEAAELAYQNHVKAKTKTFTVSTGRLQTKFVEVQNGEAVKEY